MAAFPSNVRFTPKSGHDQHDRDVRFVPQAVTALVI
jgi:hypothetical protein